MKIIEQAHQLNPGDKVTFDTDKIDEFKAETSEDNREIRRYQQLVLAGSNQVGVVIQIEEKLTTVAYPDGCELPVPTKYLIHLP